MAAAKRMTKAQIIGELSEKTGLTKREVGAVFEGLKDVIKRELGKRSQWNEREKEGKVVAKYKDFVIPDLVKLKLTEVPARKNVKVRNPGTGEETLKSFPKSTKLRAAPVKKLKDLMV
ncbi:MAG: HU family DNA-binding protein [Myxococcota bacterium]|nr:HU family DNA-binding protein [Myxococcota bacterium]